MTISEVDYPAQTINIVECTPPDEYSGLRLQMAELIGIWSCFNLSEQLNLNRTDFIKRRKLQKQSDMLLDLYSQLDMINEQELEKTVKILLEKTVKKDRGLKHLRSTTAVSDSPGPVPKS